MNNNPSFQQIAYNTLTTFFTTHIDHVAEISVLPPGIEPQDGISMQEGPNLGIPKNILALAFLEARARFFKGVKEDGVASNEAHTATHTLLLFDPEHLTAANFRKRHLLRHLNSDLLHRELTFTTTILTSPLHRQSKSPTLWHHRYWLVTTFFSTLTSSPHPNLLPAADPSPVAAFLTRELDVVLRSGTSHPKNYHAFNYARKLFSYVLTTSLSPSSPLLPILITTTKKWCTYTPNANDISGWSFFLFLLRLHPSSHSSSSSDRDEVVVSTLRTILQLRLSTLAPYLLIREAVADPRVGMGEDGRTEVQRLVGLELEREMERERRGGYGGRNGDGDGRVTFEERVRVLAEWLRKEGA